MVDVRSVFLRFQQCKLQDEHFFFGPTGQLDSWNMLPFLQVQPFFRCRSFVELSLQSSHDRKELWSVEAILAE